MESAWNVLREIWSTTTEMAPYLLFGFFVAGVLSVFISPEFVEKHLGGRGFWPVFKAALLGVPLPICSCGVIPVGASLRKHGSSKGATTAFLLSTPQTGVDSIMATYSLLGPVFAVFRPLAAFVTGIIGGSIVEALNDDDDRTRQPETCTDECCSPSGHGSKFVRLMKYGFYVLPKDIARPLIIGLLLAGLIAAFVPADFFANYLGGGILAMLVMMALGIPLYVCATASIPIAAAMMMKGVSPGAALVFLMTGPATNVAAIATFWKILGRRTTMVYLLVVAGTALASGLLLDYMFEVGHFEMNHLGHHMLPDSVKIVAAAALLGILFAAILPRGRKPHLHPDLPSSEHGDAREREFMIEGMTCSHCAATVQRVLAELPGIQSASVDLESGRAIVSGDSIDPKRIRDSITSLGYKVAEGSSKKTSTP